MIIYQRSRKQQSTRINLLSNRYREPYVLGTDNRIQALPYISSNNNDFSQQNQLHVPLPLQLTYQSVSQNISERNHSNLQMNADQATQNQNNSTDLSLFSTLSRFPHSTTQNSSNPVAMSLQLAQPNHLTDLRNVTQINFAPPKPKVTFQEMVKEIRKKKEEKQRHKEQKDEVKFKKLQDEGVICDRFGKTQVIKLKNNTNTSSLPLLSHRGVNNNNQLTPISLKIQQDELKKKEKYAKLIKNRGESYDSDKQSSSDQEDEEYSQSQNEASEEDEQNDFVKDQLQNQEVLIIHPDNNSLIKRPISSIMELDEDYDDITEINRPIQNQLFLNQPNNINQNMPELSPSSNRHPKPYQVYTLEEFNTNIGKGNYKKLGGLGPNLGNEDYNKAKQKLDARLDYDEGVRVMNKIKLVQIQKQESETKKQIFLQQSQNQISKRERVIESFSLKELYDKPQSPNQTQRKLPQTYELLNKQQMKQTLQNSARQKAKDYAKQVKRPNQSIELAERVLERNYQTDREKHQERCMIDPHDIRKTEESYKRLFNFQHVSIPYLDNKLKL
eukprot:403360471